MCVWEPKCKFNKKTLEKLRHLPCLCRFTILIRKEVNFQSKNKKRINTNLKHAIVLVERGLELRMRVMRQGREHRECRMMKPTKWPKVGRSSKFRPLLATWVWRLITT